MSGPILVAAVLPLVLLSVVSVKYTTASAAVVWSRVRPIHSVRKGKFLAVLLWNVSGYDMAGSYAGEVTSAPNPAIEY